MAVRAAGVLYRQTDVNFNDEWSRVGGAAYFISMAGEVRNKDVRDALRDILLQTRYESPYNLHLSPSLEKTGRSSNGIETAVGAMIGVDVPSKQKDKSTDRL